MENHARTFLLCRSFYFAYRLLYIVFMLGSIQLVCHLLIRGYQLPYCFAIIIFMSSSIFSCRQYGKRRKYIKKIIFVGELVRGSYRNVRSQFFLSLYHLKMLEEHRYYDVFRGHGKRSVTWNWLNILGHTCFSYVKKSSANIYLFKVNYRNNREMCEMYSKLTIKTPDRRQLNNLQGISK